VSGDFFVAMYTFAAISSCFLFFQMMNLPLRCGANQYHIDNWLLRSGAKLSHSYNGSLRCGAAFYTPIKGRSAAEQGFIIVANDFFCRRMVTIWLGLQQLSGGIDNPFALIVRF
jgi:hypothetical protein